MEKEFIPYEQALDLKELGFDEPCIAFYNGRFLDYKIQGGDICSPYLSTENRGECPNAPTFSQAFRWFRENHNLHAEPYTCDMGAIEYCFQIRDLYSEKYVYDNFRGAGGSYGGTFNTPEEAELACLKKLIELVKKEK